MNRSPEVEEIFSAAIEKSSPTERLAYIRDACRGDDWLQQRVARLVDAHYGAGGLLDGPLLGQLPEINAGAWDLVGATVGRYKLLEQIGEGGFAIVFMAEQQQPVRRKVALKIIKAGMDTKQVVARFEAERQALAIMDHPSIAKVLDGGATAATEIGYPGRPYFVMDLVKGVPITEYSDHHNLSIDQRLDLFIQVCQAVQHAHQKGVIHRDIKPTNVLVTTIDDRPLAKVIDFGIAKATGTPLTDKTLFTDFRQLIGTPAYMSPEQADGSLDIDTRSDVYSLGVLLYELLAGSPPFDPKELRSKSFAEMQRMIREVEPPTPSTRLSRLDAETQSMRAKQRKIDPLRLDQRLRGELDWIVMRALEKDRNRRYPTALALALDVERHLADEPVEASPPSSVYRLKKFVRRNKVGMLTGLAVVTALAAGLAMAAVGMVQARREAARSGQVSEFLKDMLTAAGPSVARGRDDTVLREILDKTAERVEKDLRDDPEVQGDLWFTLGSTFQDIGDYQRAIALLKQAVNSYRIALGDENTKLARALGLLGSCQSFAKDISTGRGNGQLGLDMARKCGDAETLAFCLYCRARSSNWWGMGSTESVPYLREAIALRRQLGSDAIALADCLRALGTCDAAGPEDQYNCTLEALEIYRQQLGTENPRYATALFLEGQLLINRQALVEAEQVLRDTLALWQKIYDKSHPYQPIVRRFLAESLALQSKWDEADAILKESTSEYNFFFNDVISHLKDWGKLDEALAEAEKLLESRPLAELQASPGIALLVLPKLGIQHVQRQEWPAAVAAYTRLMELKPAEQSNYHALGPLLVQSGDMEGYERFRNQAIAQFGGTDDRTTAHRIAKDCLLLPVSGPELQALAQLAEIAITEKEGAIAPRSYLLWYQCTKGLAEYRQGHYAGAIDWMSKAAMETPGSGLRVVEARSVLAMSYFRMNRRDEARDELAGAKVAFATAPALDNEDLFKGIAMGFADWFIAQALLREAQELIEGDSKAVLD